MLPSPHQRREYIGDRWRRSNGRRRARPALPPRIARSRAAGCPRSTARPILRLDRPVAIKVMDPQFAADPQFLARFEFEARAVARLNHPGLVAVYDQGRDGRPTSFPGDGTGRGRHAARTAPRTRADAAARRRAPSPARCSDALAAAHRAGLVHRDVKPENVLISDAGEVKIADFGLVRAVAAATATSRSVILGTAAYLSPEQVTAGSADARSDVYAAGVLVFEMLTGRTPFTGDTSLSVAYQRVNNDVPAPGRSIAGVPPELDESGAPRHRTRPGATVPERRGDGGRPAARRGRARTFRRTACRRPAALRDEQLAAPQLPPTRRAAATRQHLPRRFRRRSTAPQRPPPSTCVPCSGATAAGAATHAGPQPTRHAAHQGRHGYDRPNLRPPPPEDIDHGGPPTPASRSDRHRHGAPCSSGSWWCSCSRRSGLRRLVDGDPAGYTAVPTVNGLDRAAAARAHQAAGLSADGRGDVLGRRPARDGASAPIPRRAPGPRTRDSVALLVSLGRPTVPTLPEQASCRSSEDELR